MIVWSIANVYILYLIGILYEWINGSAGKVRSKIVFFYNYVLEQWNEVLCEVVDVFGSSFASIRVVLCHLLLVVNFSGIPLFPMPFMLLIYGPFFEWVYVVLFYCILFYSLLFAQHYTKNDIWKWNKNLNLCWFLFVQGFYQYLIKLIT